MRRGAAIVFLLAVLLRVTVLLVFDGGPSRPLEGDEQGYAAVAGSLARGDGFGFDISGRTTGGVLVERRLFAFRAPLLPLVLAPVHWASDGAPAALRWECILLGALAAPLAFGAAGRIGGSRAAWIAGVAVALWPSHAWLSARVLSEPLDSVLLLAGADLLLRHKPVAGGASLGFAVLCRPGGLPAVLFAVAAAASSEPARRRVRPLLLMLLAMTAVVAPWVVRNQQVFGRPLLVTSSGVTLLGGNCPSALSQEYPGKWVPPEQAWAWNQAFTKPRILFRGPPDLGMYGWDDLGEADSDARFAGKAWSYVSGRAGPLELVELAGWKAVRFLDPDTHSEKGDSLLKSILGWLSWGPTLLLVAVALWAGRKLKEPEWRLALALLLGHLLAAVIAYGDARMRAPVEPVLLALLVAPLVATGVSKWIGARDAAKVQEP